MTDDEETEFPEGVPPGFDSAAGSDDEPEVVDAAQPAPVGTADEPTEFPDDAALTSADEGPPNLGESDPDDHESEYYDVDGFDRVGYDRDGFDYEGYNRDGIHRRDIGAADGSVDAVALAEREALIAAATADLDDQTDGLLIPDSPPLTLAYTESVLNSRRAETDISPTRSRMIALMDLIGNPQQAYPIIQIAGTNGKTSTARMIDALLTRIGLHTGRFTSPHLQSVTERISLAGIPVDEDRYVEAYSDLAPYVKLVDAASASEGGLALSKFEILTGMAFSTFADTPVDVGVIEVGLGGTWDSTNVGDARIAVITPIGLDHMNFLGDTVAEIAANKAGIIKSDAVAVIGRQRPEAMDVILRRTIEVDVAVARLGSEFDVLERSFAVGGQRLTLQGLGGVYEDIFLPLAGEHQADNAAVALAAVEAFFGAGSGKQLDVGAIQDGFASASSPGRLERVRNSPTILIDAAHNPDSARALATSLAAEFSFDRLVGVLAVMSDKDVRGVLLELVNSFDEVVITVNSSPRSMPVHELAELAQEIFGPERVHTADRMDSAIALAVDLAESGTEQASGSGVVITGSVVSAGDGRALAGMKPS